MRYKYLDGLDWIKSINVFPSSTLCREGVDGPDVVCHTLIHLVPDNYSVEVRTHNADVPQASAWSNPVNARVTGQESATTSTNLIIFTTVLVLLILFILAFFLYRLFKKKSNKKKATFDFTPILKPPPPPPPSCPLPQPPSSENVYEEPRLLKQLEVDEDLYLKPNPVRVESRESLDEQGYLRPNFHRFQRMDTSSSPGSDKDQAQPFIPPVSYTYGS